MRQAEERFESAWHDGERVHSTVLSNVVEPSDHRPAALRTAPSSGG